MANKGSRKRKTNKRRLKEQKGSESRALFWLILAVCALAGGLFLMQASRYIRGFADLYKGNIYPLIVWTLGRAWGKVPFSAVEVLLYLFICFWVVFLLVSVTSIFKKKKGAFKRLGLRLLALAATCSVLFFVYEANCGVNYQATSFSEQAGLTRSGYDAESLQKVCADLTQELITLSGQVERDKNGELAEAEEWKQEAVQAMTALGEQYPQLAADYPQPKPVFISRILSVQSVTGVYSPFTVEANYNTEMASYNIPFTMCHELSHLCGYMREDEANFIGWLACRQSDNIAFQYSSAMLGWINCGNELAQYDMQAYSELAAMLPEEVRKELNINNAFWEKYEGKASQVHEQVNDAYLKANGQTEGIRTYERMVELIVSYYQAKAN